MSLGGVPLGGGGFTGGLNGGMGRGGFNSNANGKWLLVLRASSLSVYLPRRRSSEVLILIYCRKVSSIFSAGFNGGGQNFGGRGGFQGQNGVSIFLFFSYNKLHHLVDYWF